MGSNKLVRVDVALQPRSASDIVPPRCPHCVTAEVTALTHSEAAKAGERAGVQLNIRSVPRRPFSSPLRTHTHPDQTQTQIIRDKCIQSVAHDSARLLTKTTTVNVLTLLRQSAATCCKNRFKISYELAMSDPYRAPMSLLVSENSVHGVLQYHSRGIEPSPKGRDTRGRSTHSTSHSVPRPTDTNGPHTAQQVITPTHGAHTTER